MTTNDANKKVITRFAPSPTGFMHVGGVRTALFSWLWARKNNGKFILRLEDTDKDREVEGSLKHIIESLKWLGIDWDEGPDIGGPHEPYKQSERLNIYREYANKLVAEGLAYADPYTEEEVEAFRKQAETEKKAFLYRNHRPDNPPIWDGSQPLRLKIVKPEKSHWYDLVRGDLEAGEEALDDFILIKSDGFPTYNFAHVIDDYLMEVTHIFRADEFIASTPKFLTLYDALKITRPKFVTLPPILGEKGNKKLGKRDGAKDILEYKIEGYLPEAMLNFLAFIGWNPGGEKEIMTRDEIIQAFTLEHIQTGGGQFNEEKLNWLNREYILRQPVEEQSSIFNLQFSLTKWKDSKNAKDENFMKKFLKILLNRIQVWGEVITIINAGEFDYFFEKPKYSKDLLFWKDEKNENKTKERLVKVKEIFEKANENDFENSDSVKNLIWNYAEEQGRGQVLWPLRVALSGLEKSPDPFTLVSILGKQESVERLNTTQNLL